jgi:type VI secretion system lysozyme-like protein
MSADSRQHAAAVPLFERLTDRNPEQPREPRPLRTLSFPELLRSVRQEVARLLNTRGGHGPEALLGQPRSVIDYGATDLLWVNPYDPESMHTLSRLMEETIEAFEPRLRGVGVKVARFVQTESRMVLTVSATLITEDLREPVSFQVTASPRSKEPLSDE